MTDFDCNTLTGRLRDICRGHDDDGNAVLTPEKCEQYRAIFSGAKYQAFVTEATHTRIRDTAERKAAFDEAGRTCWMVLHDYPITNGCDWNLEDAARFLAKWESTIPSYGCQCKPTYLRWKNANKPEFESSPRFAIWAWKLHNFVNQKLGKPAYPRPVRMCENGCGRATE